jgi:hypothetical protein
MIVPAMGIGEAVRMSRIPPARRNAVRPLALSIGTEGDSLDILEALPEHLGSIIVIVVRCYGSNGKRDEARVNRWADARHWAPIYWTRENVVLVHPRVDLPDGGLDVFLPPSSPFKI